MNKIILISCILFHYVVFLGFGLSMLLGLFILPWYLALTIDAVIVRVMFSPNPCPLTLLENKYRKKLRLKTSIWFITDYIINIKQTVKYLLKRLAK